MIVINENDYGLSDLAGHALGYIGDQQLPEELYVYGLRDGYDYDVYLDPALPRAVELSAFINANTPVNSKVDLPVAPRRRPAIGLSRQLRSEPNIHLATRLAVLGLLAVNQRLEFPPQWNSRVNDVVSVLDIPGELYWLVDVEGPGVWRACHLLTGRARVVRNVRPAYPTDAGQRVRSLVTNPTYDRGAGVLEVAEGTVGITGTLHPQYWQVAFDGYRSGRMMYLDPKQLVRIHE